MILDENEKKIQALKEKLVSLDTDSEEFPIIKKELEALKMETYSNLTAWDS